MHWKVPQLKKYHFPPDILNNRDWYEKSFSAVLLPLYVISYGCVYIINKRVKNTFKFGMVFIKDDKMHWIWDGRDLRRIRERLLKIDKQNPKIIQGYFSQWKKDYKKFRSTMMILEKTNFTKLSSKQLFARYSRLRDDYVTVDSLPYLTDSFLSSGEEDWLVKKIKSELGAKIDSEAIQILTAPVENSFSTNERLDLLRIASFPSIESNQIKKHATKYYWIENNYYPHEELDEKYFLGKIEEIRKSGKIKERLKEEENRVNNNKLAKKRLFRELRVGDELKSIIHLSEKFTIWQDIRKSCVLMANNFIFKISAEIGKRVGLKPFEIFYATDHELKDILFKKAFDKQKLINRRKNGCAFVALPTGMYVFEGEEYRKIKKDIFLGFSKDTRVIKGVSACAGFARGKVRIIDQVAKFADFKQNEILVTNNTTPEFVPIMKKAAAIITEQGGITTHAAIVSRELGIPCVIGTKIATKVLKDGDMVEVDANKGEIKIIK